VLVVMLITTSAFGLPAVGASETGICATGEARGELGLAVSVA
jgi:hypothetical protein